jgi:hypothetical protein
MAGILKDGGNVYKMVTEDTFSGSALGLFV